MKFSFKQDETIYYFDSLAKARATAYRLCGENEQIKVKVDSMLAGTVKVMPNSRQRGTAVWRSRWERDWHVLRKNGYIREDYDKRK